MKENDTEAGYEKLNRLLEDDPEIDNGSLMDQNFYAMLEEEKSRVLPKSRSRTYFPAMQKIAAGIALFILGWFGSQLISNTTQTPAVVSLAEEVRNLKETLVLAKLDQSSASERIQALSMAGEMETLDTKVASALLTVLNSDPSVNVRLVALEILVDYVDNPDVRIGIIMSIEKQNAPVIQVRMAEIMENLDEKRSVPEFEKILNDISLDYSVRSRINETVNVLL